MANERILIVDDEKGVVRSCTRILKRHGFVVTGKTDSASVPKLLKQETFDLLLTDIKMPKIDGLELLKIAKEIDPHITVVLITGYGTMEDAVNAIGLGAQGFLLKPFEPQELIDTVEHNLARRAMVRDSLRLQTLLPLLEVNKMMQVSGGEVSLVQEVLEVARTEIGAARMAWLSYSNGPEQSLIETATVPQKMEQSQLPAEAVAAVLASARPVWVLANGLLENERAGHPNIVGALLPLIIKGQLSGILTAETGTDSQSGPFGQIGLELLSVLAGQLAIIIENIQLFQQTESLRAFNEDIINYMTNGLIAIDENCRITVCNPAAVTMFGLNGGQILNKPLSAAISNSTELVNIFDQTLATGQPQPHREITFERADGQQLHISISAAPLNADAANKTQQSAGAVGVLEDLTEIKVLEAERRQLDRLAALGEMSAVVAHEIRNPVAGIAAGIEFLTRNAPKDSMDYKGGQMIQGEVRRINRILEDILFVARPLQLMQTVQPLPPILDTVLHRCQPQITENNVIVTVNYPDNLPQVNVDDERLEQVFTNLVINAVQAMEDGGQLTIVACEDNQDVDITISDTGPGMPIDTQQQIFEPFFTTKAKGTGLGLSVARRIIEGHNGTVNFESSLDTGTSFIVKIPTCGGSAL